MMSGHGANPIFFNKKSKDWTSITLAKPPHSYVYLIFALPPPHYRLKVDVVCVSSLLT